MEFSIKKIYFFHSSRKCKCQLQNKKEKDKEIKNKAAKKENQKHQFKDNWRTPDLLSSSASSSHPHLPHWSKSIVYKISQRRGAQGKQLLKKTELMSAIRKQRRHSSLWKQTPSFYSGAVFTAGHLSYSIHHFSNSYLNSKLIIRIDKWKNNKRRKSKKGKTK